MKHLRVNLFAQNGFTLMEVLVATAITGIAIGVTMALFAQGHTQAFRGNRAQKAAEIAIRLIDSWRVNKAYPAEEEGEIDSEPGWKYKVITTDIKAELTLPTGQIHVIEPDKAKEVILKIIPPDKKRSFQLTFWVPAKEVKNL